MGKILAVAKISQQLAFATKPPFFFLTLYWTLADCNKKPVF
jgi:hypothetical protein